MRSRFPREWLTLEYRSARDFLVNVTPLRAALATHEASEKVRNLRTRGLKRERELLQASLFAYGIGSTILGSEVFLAWDEQQDFDCIAKWQRDDTWNYTPVQIKEFVPERLNAEAILQAEISKLERKYADSSDLVVAIYLNRRFKLDINSLEIPPIRIAQLWLLGAISDDAKLFGLWGDLLKSCSAYSFEYPGLA